MPQTRKVVIGCLLRKEIHLLPQLSLSHNIHQDLTRVYGSHSFPFTGLPNVTGIYFPPAKTLSNYIDSGPSDPLSKKH
jgi:hypothetical protein